MSGSVTKWGHKFPRALWKIIAQSFPSRRNKWLSWLSKIYEKYNPNLTKSDSIKNSFSFGKMWIWNSWMSYWSDVLRHSRYWNKLQKGLISRFMKYFWMFFIDLFPAGPECECNSPLTGDGFNCTMCPSHDECWTYDASTYQCSMKLRVIKKIKI